MVHAGVCCFSLLFARKLFRTDARFRKLFAVDHRRKDRALGQQVLVVRGAEAFLFYRA